MLYVSKGGTVVEGLDVVYVVRPHVRGSSAARTVTPRARCDEIMCRVATSVFTTLDMIQRSGVVVARMSTDKHVLIAPSACAIIAQVDTDSKRASYAKFRHDVNLLLVYLVLFRGRRYEHQATAPP